MSKVNATAKAAKTTAPVTSGFPDHFATEATVTETPKPPVAVVAKPAPTGNIPSITADITGTILTLTFSHGEALEIDAAKLTPEIQMQAMLHGLKQKTVDAAAIARDLDTGRSATIADKFAAVKEVADRITGEQPSWNKVREAGATSSNSLLVRAIMELTGKPRATVENDLEARSKEERAALRKNARVATIIVRLQSEKADSSIDTDSLLEELIG
jgi:hypothetical protein